MPQLILVPGAWAGGTPPPISDDIIAWYRFEETDALTVALDSKMNFHGTAPDARIAGYRGLGIHADKSAVSFSVNRVLDEIPSTLKLSVEFWARLTEDLRKGEHGTHTIFSKQWRSGMMLFAYFLSRLEALQLHVAFSYLDVDGATRTESTYTDIAAGVIPADEWTRVTVQLDLRDGFLPLSKWYSKYGVWWGDTYVARADTLAFVDIQKSFALTPEIVGGDKADLKLASNDAAIPIVVDNLPFSSSLRYGLESDLDDVIVRRVLRKASGGTERPRLTIVIVGEGTVTKDPDQDSYLPGDQVALTGAGDGVTWLFRRWRVASGTLGPYTEIGGTVTSANYDNEDDETTIEATEDLVPASVPADLAGLTWKLVFTSGALADQSFDVVSVADGDPGLDTILLDGDASSAVATDAFYLYASETEVAVVEDIIPDLVPAYTASAEAYKLRFTSGALNTQAFDIVAAAGGLTDTLTVSGDIHGIAEGDAFRVEIEDNPHTVNIPAAGRTVYAVFGGPYTLTVTIVGEGTVTIDPDKEDYALGEIVTLTAVPADGYAFYEWSGTDGYGKATELVLTMDANKAVTATFKVIQESIYVAYSSSTEGDESAPCDDDVYTIHAGEET